MTEADLHYTNFDEEGIHRRKNGKGFYYVYEDGTRVTNPSVLKRIRDLKIAPAYTDVWISTDKRDHIQAMGFDDARRPQYIYHPDWVTVRETHKYERMAEFGKALPEMRSQINRDLKREGFEKEKILAIALRVLEITQIRVGGRKYLTENGSYGLTTLTKKKAQLDGNILSYNFYGKHDQKNNNQYELDSGFAAIVGTLYNSPGVRWLRYQDKEGHWHDLTPADVNNYIKEISGGKFSAKDFRTWHGTVAAAEYLFSVGKPWDEHPQDHIDEAVAFVASRLVNTENVSRESYIFPEVFSAFEDWTPFQIAFDSAKSKLARERTGRSLGEEAVLLLLNLRDQ